MPFSEKYGYQWWGQPRTASRALMSIQGRLEFQEMNTHDCKVYNPDWDTIISIRNPYARTVSYWILRHGLLHQKQKRISFEEFVKKDNEYFRIRGLMLWNPIVRLKELNGRVFTIRNEHLIDDLMKIPLITENIELLKDDIEHLKSNRNNYRQFYILDHDTPYHTMYTQELADIVYHAKKDEFETWGYEKDSWKELVI